MFFDYIITVLHFYFFQNGGQEVLSTSPANGEQALTSAPVDIQGRTTRAVTATRAQPRTAAQHRG